MSSLLIKNAKVVLPDRVTEPGDVLVKDGKITKIGGLNDHLADKVLDAGGNYLFPGFIDVHVHGGGGADFMDGTAEAFEQVVKTHLKYGTTTLVPTAMTASKDDLITFLKNFKEFKAKSRFSAVTPGVHLEGPYFSGANSKSSGAQPSGLLRLPDVDEISQLLEVADGDILRWDAAPELAGSGVFAKIMGDNGIICAIAHTDATSEEAEQGINNGFSHVTHFYNAVTTYHKKDQKVLAGVVEAAYLNDNVTVELICDGKHIPRDILRLALKIKGADKVLAITDAMRIAGTNDKCGRLGGIKNGTDVITHDGVAKLPDLSSFAGSIATMQTCLKVLCADYGISLSDVSVMLSKAPAKLLGLLNNKGTIEIGKDADLVLVDNEFNVKKVILSDKVVV